MEAHLINKGFSKQTIRSFLEDKKNILTLCEMAKLLNNHEGAREDFKCYEFSTDYKSIYDDYSNMFSRVKKIAKKHKGYKASKQQYDIEIKYQEEFLNFMKQVIMNRDPTGYDEMKEKMSDYSEQSHNKQNDELYLLSNQVSQGMFKLINGVIHDLILHELGNFMIQKYHA